MFPHPQTVEKVEISGGLFGPKATALSLWVHVRPTAAGAHVSVELSQLALSRCCGWGENPRAVLGKEGRGGGGWPGQHGSE